MDVEFLGFVDFATDLVENDHFEEALGDKWGGGDEDLGRLVTGVRSPIVRLRDDENVFPVWGRREDFEEFGQFARLVAREELADTKALLVCLSNMDI